MAEIPVSTGSAGGSRSTGLIGKPVTGAVAVAGDRRAAVDRLAPPVAAPGRASPRRPGSRSGLPLNATLVARRAHALRCPRAPGPRPGRGRPPGPARAACSPGPRSRIVANSSQPTPATPRTTSSGPRSSATSVYSRCTQAVIRSARSRWVTRRSRAHRPLHRRRRPAGPAASIVARLRVARDRVRSAGFLPGAQDRREVLLLDRAGRDTAARPAPGSARRPRAPRSASAAARALSQLASVALSALCCRTPSLISRPARIVARSPGGSGAGAHQFGERAEPVRFGEQGGHPAPAVGPAGVARAACQAATAASSRENDPDQDTAG